MIYWTTTNLFSLGQQYWVLRKYPPPVVGKKPGTTPAKAEPAKASSASFADMILGRKPKPAPATTNGTPKVDGKALAPKPGAKPVNPKKAAPTAKATPAKATPAKKATPSKAATPNKATPAKQAKRSTG
jgi:YidC/Oxa1 family membrane protein insertase